jgi:hypothetical protein
VNGLSRRTFLSSTSATAAVIGLIATVPGLAQAREAVDASTPPASTPLLNEPLVAYVRDPGLGEIVLYVGTREVVLRDPALVARLVRATS